MSQSVLNNTAVFVLWLCRFFACRLNSRICNFLNACAFKCRNFVYRASKLARKFFNVNLVAVLSYNIHHIYGNNNRNTKFNNLCCEVKVSFKVCAVDDVKYSIGLFVDEIISCNDFFDCIRGEGIYTRKVGDCYIIVLLEFAFLFFYCYTRPVTNILV